MSEIFVQSIGLAAPGLPSWPIAASILRGESEYTETALLSHAPALLPPNERRRATPTVRLAFQAAEDAMQTGAIDASELATVFASSDADLGVIHRICTALVKTPRLISPTDFHNSVHNAAAGYWSIAVGARGPSTTISAYDYSFAAGLLEAGATVLVDGRDTLLVAFDLSPPEPMFTARPIVDPFGVALVLSKRKSTTALASLTIDITDEPESKAMQGKLEELRGNNPAARCLPLLALIATRTAGSTILALNNDRRLSIGVRPC